MSKSDKNKADELDKSSSADEGEKKEAADKAHDPADEEANPGSDEDEDEEGEEEGEGDDDEAPTDEDGEEDDGDDEDDGEDEDEDDEAAAGGEAHEAEEAGGDASEFAAKYGEERKSRPRRSRAVADDDAHDEDDDGAPSYGDEDAFWWAPHAVMGALVVFGMLGFFGAFNKPLAFMRPPNMKAETTMTEAAAPPAQPAAPTPPRPATAPGDQQPPREMMGAKHLLVMYQGSRRAPPDIKRTKDEAKTRAAEALKKAKGGKTKFEDVVKEYTDEPGGGQRGGDLGTFPKGAMVPEFQAGLDKLKVGEISDIVESPFGFHIILRTK